MPGWAGTPVNSIVISGQVLMMVWGLLVVGGVLLEWRRMLVMWELTGVSGLLGRVSTVPVR